MTLQIKKPSPRLEEGFFMRTQKLIESLNEIFKEVDVGLPYFKSLVFNPWFILISVYFTFIFIWPMSISISVGI